MKKSITCAGIVALHFCLTSCVQKSPPLLQAKMASDSNPESVKERVWRRNVGWEVSRFSWGIDSALAEATLIPWDGSLHITVNSGGGSNEVEIPLGLVDGEELHPISLALLGPTELIVGANIAGSSSGKLLLIDFDGVAPGIPYSVYTLYSGPSFAWPSSIFVNSDKPALVFIFDEASHNALSFDRGSSDFFSHGNPVLAPSLLKCRFVQAGPSLYSIPETEEKVDAWTVMCSPTESADPYYTQNTYLIDINNDSVTDFVELSQ